MSTCAPNVDLIDFCQKCKDRVPSHVVLCPVCGKDVGYPNVRAALRFEEVVALKERVKSAEDDARRRNCIQVLKDFREEVKRSKAVINMKLFMLEKLVNDGNHLYQSFYKNIGAGRLPEDNYYDRHRQSIDALLFPYYYEEIVFASLSIDRKGVEGYGPYCLILKDHAIEERASIFEDNSIVFLKTLNLSVGEDIPPGSRSTWSQRDDLAIAKLTWQLSDATKKEEFPNIIRAANDKDAKIIEVHIYGGIHRNAVEAISFPTGTALRRPDRILQKSLEAELRKIKIPII